MELNIEIKEGSLVVKVNDKINIYNAEEGANLTNLIEEIGDSPNKVKVIPSTFNDFKLKVYEEEILVKIVEYIYKIIDAFNDAYFEVYEKEKVKKTKGICK